MIYLEQVEAVKNMIQGVKFDVVVVPEHWRGENDRVREELGVQKTQRDIVRERNILGENIVWMRKVRSDAFRASGGVGIAIKKDIGEIIERPEHSDEGLIWAEIKQGIKSTFIGGIYLVPPSSEWYDDNLDRVARLMRGIEFYKQQGEVLLMGDMNARVATVSYTHLTLPTILLV